jgi:hypothetical protein
VRAHVSARTMCNKEVNPVSFVVADFVNYPEVLSDASN